MRKRDTTGKGPDFGNTVSHSNRKKRRVRRSNIQRMRVRVPEERRWIHTNLSTRATRTLDQKGLKRFLKDEGLTLKDIA